MKRCETFTRALGLCATMSLSGAAVAETPFSARALTPDATWQSGKLNMIDATGEYMIRLVLIDGPGATPTLECQNGAPSPTEGTTQRPRAARCTV